MVGRTGKRRRPYIPVMIVIEAIEERREEEAERRRRWEAEHGPWAPETEDGAPAPWGDPMPEGEDG